MGKKLPVREYASAGGVVIDATGESVLMLLRPERPGPAGQPELRLPKGHIEPGERRREAALREVGEESGLSGLAILADLGHQIVEFDWKGHHYIRDESYFLMMPRPGTLPGVAEGQFEALWLPWQEALVRVTYEAEREWIRRAQAASTQQIQPDMDAPAGRSGDHEP